MLRAASFGQDGFDAPRSLPPSPGPIGDRRAVVERRAKLVLRRWSFRMGLYVAKAEHHEGLARLVFGGKPDLVACKL